MHSQIVTVYCLSDDLLKALYHHEDWQCKIDLPPRFGAEPFFVPRLSANLAWYWGNGLPRPETRDYLGVDTIEGIKDVASHDGHGKNIKTVNGLS
jgi:hypothetical protein